MSALQQALLMAGAPLGGNASILNLNSGSGDNIDYNVDAAAGTLVILGLAAGNASNIDISITSGGWTELADLYANDTRDTNLAVFWKYYSSEEYENVTFSHAVRIAEAQVSGAVASNPFTQAALTATGINSVRPIPPTITIPDDALIICFGSANVGTGIGGSSLIPVNSPIATLEPFYTDTDTAIGVYDSSRSGLTFTQWSNASETPAEGSWCAVTLGIK